MNGLGKQEVAAAGGRNDEDEKVAKEMQQRLKDAADKARDNANAKAFKPDPPSQVVGKGNAAEGQGGERSVAGRKKMGDKAQEVVKEGEKEEEDMEVTTELNTILKKSPSWLPFSFILICIPILFCLYLPFILENTIN